MHQETVFAEYETQWARDFDGRDTDSAGWGGASPPSEPDNSPPPLIRGRRTNVSAVRQWLRTVHLPDTHLPETQLLLRQQKRRLALQYHPDKAGEEDREAANARWVEMQTAFERLNEQYDATSELPLVHW
jgi:hypothetical protein